MKNIYIDMDGTLTVFQTVASEEELYEPGYFARLEPQKNVVAAVRELSGRDNIEVFILSAVLPSPYAKQEKNEWLDTYLPEINSAHRIFVPCGEDKGKYIGHALGEDDLLLDDYSKNLRSWCPPGRAVKLINDINGNFGTWRGAKISMHLSPAEIAGKVCEAAGLELYSGRNYEVIKSQTVENTSSTVFIGYNSNATPPNEPSYCCWIEKNGTRSAVTTAFSESEALISFYDQISALERSVPQLVKVQPKKRIPIREQLAAVRLRRAQNTVKAPTVSKKDKGIER